MGGGSGYVLSKKTLELLQEAKTRGPCIYPGVTEFEDVNMGICFKSLGIKFIDTRDSNGRQRFLPYPPWILIDQKNENKPKYLWLKSKSKYPFHFGIENLSDSVISFHEIRNPSEFYLLQYFLNFVRIE